MGCGLRDDEGKRFHGQLKVDPMTIFLSGPLDLPISQQLDRICDSRQSCGEFQTLGNFIGNSLQFIYANMIHFVEPSEILRVLVKPGWDPTLFEDERRAAVEDGGRLAEAR